MTGTLQGVCNACSQNEVGRPGGRVAIVDGLRTPFARIATHYRDLNAIDLGAMAVQELMAPNNPVSYTTLTQPPAQPVSITSGHA